MRAHTLNYDFFLNNGLENCPMYTFLHVIKLSPCWGGIKINSVGVVQCLRKFLYSLIHVKWSYINTGGYFP